MQGVMVDLAIGAVLFTPIGFAAGYLQHKKALKQEKSDNELKNNNEKENRLSIINKKINT
jgi:hypothetical protein